MNPEIQDALRAQNRRRRSIFWAGFLAMAVVGGLWAGFSKDPVRPEIFGLLLVPSLSLDRIRPAPDRRRPRRRRPAIAAASGVVVAARLAVGVGVAVGVAVAVIMFVAAGPAAAQEDEFATVDIEITGPIGWNEGRPVSATVVVETLRAVSGELIVTDTPDGGSTTSYEFTVDLAAGTVAQFPVTLITSWDGVDVSAQLRSNGEIVAEDRLNRGGNGEAQLGVVGTLDIDSPPKRVEEIGTANQLATLNLDRGLRGLHLVSSVVAPPRAVEALGADTEQGLQLHAWLRGGGQLVVDGPSRSLADRYHRFPTANPDRFAVGAGSVVYSEDWESGIPLGGYVGQAGVASLIDQQGLGSGSTGELSLLAGIGLPSVALVAAILLVYSVLAGPVLFGAVSVRKIERKIWLWLPALSLLFTVGILGFGFSTRSGRSDTHITIVEVDERGSRATSNLLLTSGLGGRRAIDAPETWSYLGQGRTAGQRPIRLQVGASTTELSIDMPPGSSAVTRLTGLAPQYDGLLTIGDIGLDGEDLVAVVKNNGDSDLTDAVAMVGNARAEVGTIPAGDSVTISVEAATDTVRMMRELLIWPRVENRWTDNGTVAVPLEEDASTAAGSWTEWRAAQGSAAMPENVVAVVAWTDDLSAPLAGVDSGRTALMARANIPASVRDSTGLATAVRLPDRQTEPVFDGNFAGYLQDYRVTLEPDFELDRLAIKATRNSAGLAFLVDGDWRFAPLGRAGDVTIAVPPEAVSNGEILFRSYESDQGWGSGVSVVMVVDAEETESVPLVSDVALRGAAGPFQEQFVEQGLAFDPENGALIGPQELRFEVDDMSAGGGWAVGETLSGEGYHSFGLTLDEGQNVSIDMTSDDGATYLDLWFESELLQIDDGAGNSNSRLTLEAAPAGDYEIRAASRTGPMQYQLSIEVE